MPNDPSRPQSWRGEDRSALPVGKKSGPSSQYAWKPGAAPPTPGTRGRKTKVFFFTFAGAICLAALVWLILLLIQPRPTCITVVASDFRPALEDMSLPLNIYGDRGARDFLEWANTGDRARRKWCSILGDRARAWPVSTGRREDDWLRALADRKEDHVIIYIAQPGGADERGNAFLFDEKGGRLEFAKILQGLKTVRKRKLLVVDATQTPTDWRHGLITNDFAAGVQKLEKEISEDPNLLVLLASAPGQRSWVSEEFGIGIFTHYLLEGLTGAAAPGDRDAIYASDLFGYVVGKTDEWVQRNRADRERPFSQTPILLPSKAEKTERATKFLLAYRDRSAEPADKPNKKPLREVDLATAWKRCDELAGSTPPPWAYTPRLWHRYLGLLMRYERLLRAGEEEAAAKVGAAVSALAGRLDAARKVEAAEALSAGLSLPAALGRDVTVDDVKLAELCERPLPQLENLAKELKDLAPTADESVPRLKYVGHLLTKAQQDPKKLDDVVTRIGKADDGGANRPAEAHLAVMLANYKAPGWTRPSPDLIRLSLETRRLADEATLSLGLEGGHPYSERLPTGLREELQKADRDRRRGEDLLFSASHYHQDAKVLLTSAKLQYEQVRKATAPIRRAIEMRDLVFAGLPGLTDWVALLRNRDSDDRVRRLESLWKEAHALADRLARLDPLDETAPPPRTLIEAPADNQAGKDLLTHAEDVHQEYESLVKLYRDTAQPLSRSDGIGQTLLQDMETMLVAPGMLNATERVNLLKRLRENSAKLAQGNQPPTPGESVNEADLARYQGRLARALLGTTIMDALHDSNLGKTADLMDDTAPRLGMQLGGHWQKLLDEPDQKQRKDTAQSKVPLPWRERLGLAAGTRLDLPLEGSLEARNTRWELSFRKLAERAELDHWYDEKQPPLPFSEKLAIKYLRALPEERSNDLTAKLVGRRDRGKLQIKPPEDTVLTTEKFISTRFEVREMDASFEPGSATLSASIDKPNVLNFQKPPEPHPVNLARDAAEVVSLTAVSPLDARQDQPDVNLTLAGFYRGQVVNGAVAKLPVRPIPDLIVSRPPPRAGAQIAARADDNLDLGAIAIIFDCSGSMVIRDPNNKKKILDSKKFDDAKNALRDFQRSIPSGTYVTLWAYGFDDGAHYEDCEKILTIPSWDAKDPRKSDQLYEAVRGLDAFGYTPLLKTMKDALDDKGFKDAPGFKTLVVLSDGCDEPKGVNVETDPEHSKKIGAQFQTEIVEKRHGFSLQMLLFQLNDKESKIAEVQFPKSAFEQLGRQSKKHEPKTAEDLKEYLALSVRPRLEITRHNQKLHPPLELVCRRPTDPVLEWAPSPPLMEYGQYEAHVRGLEQKFILEEGDRLALRLCRTDTGLRLVRELMADEKSNSGVKPIDGMTPDAPYVLSLIVDSLDGAGETMRGKFALEDRAVTRSETAFVRFDRPRFVWWEFRVAGQKEIPRRSRVTMLYGTTSPSWECISDRWDSPNGNRAKAAVEVWAMQSDPEAIDDRMIAAGETVFRQPVDGKAAILESAGFETFTVPDDSSGNGKPQECFVVRIYSPAGRVYMPMLGSDVKADVHRYYFGAKRSTSAFILPGDAKNKPIRLKLISVDDTKQRAIRLGRDPLN